MGTVIKALDRMFLDGLICSAEARKLERARRFGYARTVMRARMERYAQAERLDVDLTNGYLHRVPVCVLRALEAM